MVVVGMVLLFVSSTFRLLEEDRSISLVCGNDKLLEDLIEEVDTGGGGGDSIARLDTTRSVSRLSSTSQDNFFFSFDRWKERIRDVLVLRGCIC